jgi:hypothetical protein
VNQSRKQHHIAIRLLKELGLDNIRLELGHDGRYHYHAWSAPLTHTNGSPLVLRQGVVSGGRK